MGPGGPVAALAVSVPLTVLCTPSPLCVCAGRDSPRAGTHRTANQCGVISPGASHATTRGRRDGSGVHTPSVHRRPRCPCPRCCSSRCRLGRYRCVAPPGAERHLGAAWGGAPFGCRLGRSTVWVPPGQIRKSCPRRSVPSGLTIQTCLERSRPLRRQSVPASSCHRLSAGGHTRQNGLF